MRALRLSVRTTAFHVVKTGSTPVGRATSPIYVVVFWTELLLSFGTVAMAFGFALPGGCNLHLMLGLALRPVKSAISELIQKSLGTRFRLRGTI